MTPDKAHELLTELISDGLKGDVPFWKWPFNFFWRQPEGSRFRRGFGVCFDTMHSPTSRVIVVVTCPVPLNLVFGWLHRTYWTIRCGMRCRAGRTIHEFFHSAEAKQRDADRLRKDLRNAMLNGWEYGMMFMEQSIGKGEDERRALEAKYRRLLGIAT